LNAPCVGLLHLKPAVSRSTQWLPVKEKSIKFIVSVKIVPLTPLKMVKPREIELPPCKKPWLPEKWSFLASPRFWAMVGFALADFLVADGYISKNFGNFLMIVSGGFVGVGTLDRTMDKFGRK